MNLLDANDAPGVYPASLYAHDVSKGDGFRAAQGEIKTDVCIIGGGFTGLSAALHLRARGFGVTVLEAQRVGFGASGRNGGQVGTGQRLDQEELEPLVGKEHARALWDISLQAVDLVRELCGRMNVAFHDGIIHADHRERFVNHSREFVEKMNTEYGHDHLRFLDIDEIRTLVNSKAYFGGSLDLRGGHIQPLKFALGLAKLAHEAGAQIHEMSRVTEIVTGSKVVVKTDAAHVQADHLLVACNGYLGNLVPSVASKVMPINNFIAATTRMSDDQKESLIRHNYAVADSKFVINYFRFSEDNRLLFGGTESYGYKFPSDIANSVRRPLSQIFPQLADVGIDFAWGGTLGITMNRMPHFERLEPNILSLSGYSGHGVALATLGGQIAAETIAGQSERFDVMATVPTPNFPGGVRLRQPLLVLAMIWYSLRDRL